VNASDLARWVIVVLAMATVALLLAGSIHRWHVMPKRIQRAVPWVIATYAVIAYGAGEAAHQHAAPGYRIVLMILVLCGLVVALSYRIDDDDYSE
jgi:hypothetical protein